MEETYEVADDEALEEIYDYDHQDWEDDGGGEDDGEAETDEAYYNEAANEEPIDEFFWEAEQQYEEDYATYLDARRQMAHLKASRGFYPVVALTGGGQAASSKCLKCGQPGHWAASCPQNTARSSPILPGRALLPLLRHHLQRSLELMGPRSYSETWPRSTTVDCHR